MSNRDDIAIRSRLRRAEKVLEYANAYYFEDKQTNKNMEKLEGYINEIKDALENNVDREYIQYQLLPKLSIITENMDLFNKAKEYDIKQYTKKGGKKRKHSKKRTTRKRSSRKRTSRKRTTKKMSKNKRSHRSRKSRH